MLGFDVAKTPLLISLAPSWVGRIPGLTSGRLWYPRIATLWTFVYPCARKLTCGNYNLPNAGRNVAAVCALGLLCVSTNAFGAAWVLDPQLRVGVGYDDNRNLVPDPTGGVTATRAAGDIAISRKTEISEIRGLVRLDYVSYFGGDDPPDDSTQLYGFVSRFRPENQRTEFEVGGAYRVDTLLRSATVVYDPDDVSLEPDEGVDDALIRRVDVKRERFDFRPRVSHRFTERMSAGLDYRYDKTDYDRSDIPGLFPFTDETISGDLTYGATELDTVRVRLSTRLYRAPEADSEYQSDTVRVRYTHPFSETFRTSAELGYANTRYDTITESGENDGIVYRLEARKLFGLTRFTAAVGRDQYPSGSGDIVETDELILNLAYRWSETTTLSLRTRFYEVESLRLDNPDVNRRYMLIRPTMRWRLARRWLLEASYRYRRQKRDTDLESADSNAVLVSIVYTQPTTLE